MEIYVNELRRLILDENQRQNLISRKTADQEIDKHIADSLILMQLAPFSEGRVIDIGSGAGFPGLVLALSAQEVPFTLLESDLKKSGFLMRAAQELGLTKVQVVRERAEVLGHDPFHREQYTMATGRAVAKIRVMLEYAIPFLQVGGWLWLWKGPGCQEEIDEAAQALTRLSAVVQVRHAYQAIDGNERVLVGIEKIKRTEAKYPRPTGVPTKRPL